MRVPNEKQLRPFESKASSRAESTFTTSESSRLEARIQEDDKGKSIGATWTGKLVPYGICRVRHARAELQRRRSLVWKFVQYYEDGSKEEFTVRSVPAAFASDDVLPEKKSKSSQ